MKNQYIYSILFLWTALLSASPVKIKVTDSLTVSKEVVSVVKDSLSITKKGDAIKQQESKVNNPLLARWQKEKEQKLLASTTTVLEQTTKFRSFPELDSHTGKIKDKIVEKLSEFTKEYLQELKEKRLEKTDKNTQKAIEAGENVFKIIEENQNFINVIGGKEIVELPVGIKKSISASSDITLGIVSMEYHPNYTEVDIFAKVNIGELGVTNLVFAANNVKISKDGGIYEQARLTLLEDAYVGQNGGQWLFIFKGGKDSKTGKGDGPTYIDIDCEGKVKEIGLSLDVRIAKSVAIPVNEDGSIKFPGRTEPAKGESPKDNDSYLGVNFALQIDNLGGLLVPLDLPMFELKALPNWGFKMEDAILDLSDLKNAPGIQFPEIYKTQGLLQGNDNLWRGFHSNEVRVVLPPEFKKKGSEKRIAIGARNLFIDNFGVSGDFYATDVYSLDEGDANKWQMSLDSIGVDLKVNRFIKAGFNGEIVLPISDEKSTGGKLAYKGLITADQFYSVNVEATEDVSFDIFKAKAKLLTGSYITLEVENNKFYPEANLTGLMSFSAKHDAQFNQLGSEQLNDSTAVADLEFEGLSFQDFKIQSRQRPYLSIGYAGFKDDITLPKLAGFELGFYDVSIKTDAEENAILALNCFVNLDKSGIHGDVGLKVIGEVKDDDLLKWRYKELEITDIEIDVKRKSFEFYGRVAFFKNDPIYGKGFAGELQLYAEDLGIEVGARGLFGTVDDYKYWFVDGHGRPTKSNNKNFTIYDIGGGVYHHMRKAGMNEEAKSYADSGILYQPDKRTRMGFKALMAFEVKKGGSFTGLAGVEVSFNSKSAGGGISRLGFYGAAMLIQGKSGASNKRAPFGTVDEMQKTVSVKEQSLSNFHELSIDKEGLKYFADKVFPELLTGEELFAAQVAIDFDFSNRSYFGLLDVFLNAGKIRGDGEKNRLGYLEYYNSPDDWYIYVGTPTKRFGLAGIPIGVATADINMYFMTGTILPDPAAPPANVIDILNLTGNELLFGRNFNQELARGTGYAFGAKFELNKNFNWGLIYARVEAGVGFDLMMRDFGDARCKGKEGPIGMDGWYATGQMYAYLQGEIGVKIRVFGIRKRIPVLKAGVAVLAQAQLPNPWFIKGYAGVKINVLGVIKIRSRLKVIIGKECEIIGKTGLQEIVMISDISPRDGLTDIDVFDPIQVAFNAPIGEQVYIEDDIGRKTYRIKLSKIEAKIDGVLIEGEYTFNDEKDLLVYNSHEIFPPKKEINFMVKVAFEEKVGSNWMVVTDKGKPVFEEKEVTFTTGDAPRKIPLKNIKYMYPIVDQQYMLPEESTEGYIQLDKGQNYLFGNGYKDELYFIDEVGNKAKANFSYNTSEKRLHFNIPNLNNETKYTYALITLNPGDIEEENVMSSVEFKEVSENLEISNNTIVGNASNNNAFISRLHFGFKTSKYNTFKQKMRSLKVAKSITSADKFRDTDQLVANVGRMTLILNQYEPFGTNDINGSIYTQNIPLIQYKALLLDKYYKDDIYTLIYKEYPLDGDIKLEREETLLGRPPVKSMRLTTAYSNYAKVNPNSSYLTKHFPYSWNLPIVYYYDYKDLQYQITNRYMRDGVSNLEKYNKYEYLIWGKFPFMRREKYTAEFEYILPSKTNGNTEIIKYENTF